MYNLDFETFKKLVDTYNTLNQLEVKGMPNLQLLYNSIYTLQQVIQQLNEQKQAQETPVKEGG
jgi:prefoldin subunit 5